MSTASTGVVSDVWDLRLRDRRRLDFGGDECDSVASEVPGVGSEACSFVS